MGFLDGLVKSAARTAARRIVNEVVDDAMDDVIGNIRGNQNSQNNSYGATQTANSCGSVESAVFSPVVVSGCTNREFKFYTRDDNGKDVVVKCQFQLPGEFVPCDCGAGEVDSCYVYSPSEVASGYAESIEGKPYISFLYDEVADDITTYYLKNGSVKAGQKLTKIDGSFVKYKVERTQGNEYLTSYHYYRRFESNLMYQIELSVPKKLQGSELHKEMERALDNVVRTVV